MYHLGDPCIHCGMPHDAIENGPCQKSTGLAALVRNIKYYSDALAKHDKDAEEIHNELLRLLNAEQTKLNQSEIGLDTDKVALAETVMFATEYALGGKDRNSARQDAIKWFSGQKIGYLGLKYEFFGTKNYSCWVGQREDCKYGYSPRHGSTCFKIGLKDSFRGSAARDLTDDEREAAIYYLINIEEIQNSAATKKEATA